MRRLISHEKKQGTAYEVTRNDDLSVKPWWKFW